MTGRRLGRFEILEQIGEGGMGVVFKARDTHLDRMVALKILPAGKVGDAERRRRFALEAKAASTLNHPGIVTIHDIDSADGELFIAMEFVAGRTLGQWIKSGKRNLRDALRYAVQITEALTAAHAAGIVHRDLKPGNVMITGEGPGSRAKVLDFGLAKLADVKREPTDATLTTPQGEPVTGEGVVVGTTAYMSPEQAEGKPVDGRSDVFSFGSVLYEMVTGRRAFHGDTALSTLSSILKDDPKPVSQLAADTPPEVERVISRCLRKDPSKRFQHMDDLKVALEELLEESSSGRLAPGKPEAPARKKWLWPALAALAFIGTSAAWFWMREKPAAPVKAVELQQRQLTFDPGLTTDPTVWPVGRMIAYASDRAGGGLDIWVQHLDTNETRRLTTHQADESEPSFSPDGTRIAYYSSRDGGGVYTVSTLGGEERKVAQHGRSPRFSPDGKWIAYWLGIPRDVWLVTGGGEIHVVPSHGGTPKRVAADLQWARSPVWAPDSNRLLVRGNSNKDSSVGYWFIAGLDGGVSSPVLSFATRPTRPLRRLLGTWWEGDRLYFLADLADERGVWSLKLDGVQAGPLSLDAAERVGISPAEGAVAMGGQLLYTRQSENGDIWMLPVHADLARVTGEPTRITGDVSPEWNCGISADGSRVVYVSRRSGEMQILLQDLRTGQNKKLAQSPNIQNWARINRDATLVAYSTYDKGSLRSHVLDLAKGETRQICEQCQLRTFSSAGDSIWVTDRPPNRGRRARFRLIRVADGAVRSTFESAAAGAPRPSADDRWMALYDSPEGGLTKMIIIPLREGSPAPESEWVVVTDGTTLDVLPEFSPNGRHLYFQSQRDGFQCIWAQRLDENTKQPIGSPFPIQHFHQSRRSPAYTGPGLRCNAVAVDKIAFTMAERTGNIWTAELPK